MPSYDYRCSTCEHEFEEFQSISAEPLEVCPSCGEASLKRLVGGGIGIIFKGSGFYVTDNKGSKTGASNGGNGASSGKSGDAESGSNGNGSSGGEQKVGSGPAKENNSE